MNTVHNWILVLAAGYMEFSSYRDKNVYRRTVDYRSIPWC